jgi:hypothetical protein
LVVFRINRERQMRAEIRAGELLIEMKERGERQKSGDSPRGNNSKLPVLKDLGVSATQSPRWQMLVSMPKGKQEENIDKNVADRAQDLRRGRGLAGGRRLPPVCRVGARLSQVTVIAQQLKILLIEPAAPIPLDRHDMINAEPRVRRRRPATLATHRTGLPLEKLVTRRPPRAAAIESLEGQCASFGDPIRPLLPHDGAVTSEG